MQTLDIRTTEIGGDFVRGTLPADDHTRQSCGTLDRGASVALAETLGSTTAMLRCDEGRAAAGLEISARHLRGVREGVATGAARPATSAAVRRYGISRSKHGG